MRGSLRRSQLEIFVDILKVIKEKPLRLSHITLKAKINFITVNTCLIQLSHHNLIKERVVKKRKQENTFFAITNEGIRFLKIFQQISVMFSKEKSSSNTKLLCKEILGTMVSCKVSCNNKDPREIQKEIDEGIHDDLLKS